MENKGIVKLFVVLAFLGIFLSPVLTAAQNPVTLDFLTYSFRGPDDRQDTLDIIAEYEKRTGNKIRMSEVPVSVLPDRQVALLMAGTGMDIFMGGVMWSNVWAGNEWLVDITDWLDELDVDDWMPGSWDSVTYEDRIYGLPVRRDPFGFLYNVDMFEEAGIEKFPETIDEFLEVLQILTKPEEGIYGIGLAGADHPQTVTQFVQFLFMFNNPMFNEDLTESVVNNEQGIAAMQFYADLANKYKVAQPTAASDTRGDAEKLFFAGRVAMILNGPWLMLTIPQQAPDLNWSVGLIPRPVDGEVWALSSGWDIGIPVTSKNPEAVWEFLKIYAEPENMGGAVTTFPARFSALELPKFQEEEKLLWHPHMSHLKAQPATPVFSDVGLIVREWVHAAVAQAVTPEEAALEIHERTQKLLAEHFQR